MSQRHKSSTSDSLSVPTTKEIQAQFEKISTSPEFHATKQQFDFFSFVVSETLNGRSDNLKGYLVATEVFGRAADFDPSTDPIVSIQANKLRRALERYYLVEGSQDPIRIGIPKGAYVPCFTRMNPAKTYEASGGAESQSVPGGSWPTLLVQPFKNMTGDPEQDFLGLGLSTELTIEISCFENVRVIYSGEGNAASDTTSKHRFLLDGQIFKDAEGIKLTVYLIDTKTSMHLWGDTCSTGLSIEEMFSFKEKVVKGIATKVCGEFGVIPKAVCRESRHKQPIKLSTYEALLRYWEYDQTLTPESFTRAFAALTHAVKQEPDCCHVLASLAGLYSIIHNLDIDGFTNPLDRAIEYAEKAADICPNNQRIMTIMALVRLSSNKLTSAISLAHRALELNPNSLYMMDFIAWILTLSGDWKNGQHLAEKAVRRNPYHRATVHDALWLNYIRQQKFEMAHVEAWDRQRPLLFWDPLIKASTLGLLGRSEEGRYYIDKLLELRPDFPEKWEQLIRRFIKFDDVFQLIVTGLHKAGLKMR